MRRGAGASRASPRPSAAPGRLALRRGSAPLVPRRSLLRHRDRHRGGLTSEGPTSCPHNRTPRSAATSMPKSPAKLIAAIEADPGQPSMPWRRSSGPLFMPVNALTGNAYNGINIVSLWVSAEVQRLQRADLGRPTANGPNSVPRSARARSPRSSSSTRSTTPTRIPMSPTMTASAAWPVRPTSSMQPGRRLHPAGSAGAAWPHRAHRSCRPFCRRDRCPRRARRRARLLPPIHGPHPDARRRPVLRHRYDDAQRRILCRAPA